MKIAEETQRQIALCRSNSKCEVCDKELTYNTWQGAHRIANTKANRKKYGDLVIDHPLNIKIVCSLKCNDKCNIGYNKIECLKLVKEIAEYELKRSLYYAG